MLVADLEQLAERAFSDIGLSPGIVGIDGIDGIGKSPLAKLIAERLNVPVISLDEHLVKEQNKYVNALQPTVGDAVKKLNGSGIIEGVCLLAVAERFAFKIDTLVYIKRTHLNMWADADMCEFDCSPDEVISREENQLMGYLEWERGSSGKSPPSREEAKLSGLRIELIRYHHEYRPQNQAKFVYEVEHT